MQEGVRALAASGREPWAIVKTLQETIKPLLGAGKAIEADAELDRLLEQIKQDANAPGCLPVVPGQSGCNKVRSDPADHFSVWISRVDGNERTLVLNDPNRQMAHTRVSPDLKWVVSTTYNNPGKDGFAKEADGYANTRLVGKTGSYFRRAALPESDWMG